VLPCSRAVNRPAPAGQNRGGRIMIWKITTGLFCLSLVACASAEHRAALAQMESDCAAGDQSACSHAVYQRSVNQDEAVKNGLLGAAVGVLLPIMLLGAVAQSQEDAGVCGWGKHAHAC
jgi:hypothetical protein